jgi:TolB-like protein
MNRYPSLLWLIPFFAAAPLSFAALPITTIAGRPPTTAPAAPVSVMLLPFRDIGPGNADGWISEAIQEDLTHDLTRNSAIQLVRPASTQPVAPSDGLAVARRAQAQKLVSGSYQVVDDQLRITAEVIDANQTQPAGEIKATGRVRDLFQLEDSLASQLWHILPQPTEQASANQIEVTPLEDYVSSQAAPAPQVYDAQPQVTPAPIYDNDSYGDAYGDAYGGFDQIYPYDNYAYGYPYFGVPLFIYGGYGHASYHHGGDYHGFYGGNHFGGGHYTGGGARFFGGTRSVGPHVASPGVRAFGGAGFAGHR